MKYTLPKNVNDLNALIATAITSANTMKEKVQIAAVAILHHAFQHGDYTKANELIEGLGHGVKRDSLVAWFVKFGGLTVDPENASNGFTGWSGKDYIKQNFDGAKAKMWYDEKKATGFEGYSFEDDLRKVMKKHTAMLKKAEKMDDKDREKIDTQVSEETIKQLLNLCNFEAVISEEDEQQAAA